MPLPSVDRGSWGVEDRTKFTSYAVDVVLSTCWTGGNDVTAPSGATVQASSGTDQKVECHQPAQLLLRIYLTGWLMVPSPLSAGELDDLLRGAHSGTARPFPVYDDLPYVDFLVS